jgi:hypothetical protein
MRIYWPWWMFPVAFAFWFTGAMVRLAAWPFQLAAARHEQREPRQTITLRVRVSENAEKPAPPRGVGRA